MSTRRRSDRYGVEIPVWLKDGQDGDRTVTTDVSAHGIAVMTTQSRSRRQYVELELTLPGSGAKVGVTAIVARQIQGWVLEDGRRGVGLGLDFFLLDSKAKQEWHQFIHSLAHHPELLRRSNAPNAEAAPGVPSVESSDAHSGVPEAAEPRDAASLPKVPRAPEPVEGLPTYIVRPRDLERLWGFFHQEMTRGLVRIETPVSRDVGSPAELLVVHPDTEAEWTLRGRVDRVVDAPEGRQAVLEIGLEGDDDETRAAFRHFVATGEGMIEEDVSLSIMSLDGLKVSEALRLPLADSLDDDAHGHDEVSSFAAGGLVEGVAGVLDSSALVSLPTAEAVAAWVPPEDPTLEPSPSLGVGSALSAEQPESLLENEGLPSLPDKVSVTASGETKARKSRVFSAFFSEADAAHRDRAGSMKGPSDPALESRPSDPALESRPSDPALESCPSDPALESRPSDSTVAWESGPSDAVPPRKPLDPQLMRDIAAARAKATRTPNSVTACYQLGRLLMRANEQHQVEEALFALKRVIQLEPNHPGAHHALAETLCKLGKASGAREHLNRAKRLGYQISSALERQIADLLSQDSRK